MKFRPLLGLLKQLTLALYVVLSFLRKMNINPLALFLSKMAFFKRVWRKLKVLHTIEEVQYVSEFPVVPKIQAVFEST